MYELYLSFQRGMSSEGSKMAESHKSLVNRLSMVSTKVLRSFGGDTRNHSTRSRRDRKTKIERKNVLRGQSHKSAENTPGYYNVHSDTCNCSMRRKSWLRIPSMAISDRITITMCYLSSTSATRQTCWNFFKSYVLHYFQSYEFLLLRNQKISVRGFGKVQWNNVINLTQIRHKQKNRLTIIPKNFWFRLNK